MNNFELIEKLVFRLPQLPYKDIDYFVNLDNYKDQITWIKEKTSDPLIMEALYVASPNLYSQVVKWKNNEIKIEKQVKKLEATLVKYLLRMGTRCTPFGYFAGVSIGNWGKGSSYVIDEKKSIKKRVSLDHAYLVNSIKKFVDNNPSVKAYLKFYPNTTFQKFGERAKYVSQNIKLNRYVNEIQNVHVSDYLREILEFCRNGKKVDELINLLLKYEVTKDEARDYINLLVSNNIILSEFNLGLNNGFPFDNFSRRLSEIATETNDAALVRLDIDCQRIENQIKHLEQGVMDNPEVEYSKLKFQLQNEEWGSLLHFQSCSVIETSQNILDFKVAGQIRKAARALNKLHVKPINSPIIRFQEKFAERFENRIVPLLQALDSEAGIAYRASSSVRDDNPLIEGFNFSRERIDAAHEIIWDKVQALFLTKILEARKTNSYVINLDNNDLKEFPEDWENVPDTLTYITKLVSLPEESKDALMVNFGAGRSALGTINRFTHMDDAFKSLGEEIVRIEEELNPNVIVADVIHLPDNLRYGNIVQSAIKRKYDVPFMVLSNSDQNEVIYLNEIYLRMHNARLVLWSKKHNAQIKIIVSNAFNFGLKTHPVYHFLGDFQFHTMNWPNSLEWGYMSTTYKFMPRVCFEDVVLKAARWRFANKELLAISKSSNKIDRLSEFRKKWKIPLRVQLMEGDNAALIDFSNRYCLDFFFQAVRKNSFIELEEFLAPSKAHSPSINGNVHCNELMAFFKRKDLNTPFVQSTFIKDEKKPIQETFIPGEEWVYYKVYCGTKNADIILLDYVKDALDLMLKEGLIDKWFFIRYYDTDYHLRLRFHLKENMCFGRVSQILTEMFNKCVANKISYKIQMDTYEREIERYGADSIEIAETIFFIDSTYVLSVLKLIKELDTPDEYRWKYSIICTVSIMDAFGLSILQKQQIMRDLDNSKHFNVSKSLGKKYRELESELNNILIKNKEALKAGTLKLLELEQGKIDALKMMTAKIPVQNQAHMDRYIMAYIHMTINRICLARPNQNETIIYGLLNKYYSSQLAKKSV